MLARRTRVAVGLLCGLGLVALSPGLAAPDDDKAKGAEAKKLDISKLPNDGLLKHATGAISDSGGTLGMSSTFCRAA